MTAEAPSEWEGDPHVLVVTSVRPPDYPLDDGEVELEYEIEHAPSCKLEDKTLFGPPVMGWDCDVTWAEADGIEWALSYSGTPVTEPGTYVIVAWGARYTSMDFIGYEYDGGLRVVADDPAVLFPLPGGLVKCGNRLDLPKKARRHQFVSLGLDIRNCGSEGFREREILACTRCGTDKAKAVASLTSESEVRLMPDDQPQLCACGAHEMHDVAVIGEWTHGILGARRSQPKTVRAITETEPIWERGDLPRAELTARITTAGTITCEHALQATTLLDGSVDLANGVHRWAVATELGITKVPVRMAYEPAEPAWAWSPFMLG